MGKYTARLSLAQELPASSQGRWFLLKKVNAPTLQMEAISSWIVIVSAKSSFLSPKWLAAIIENTNHLPSLARAAKAAPKKMAPKKAAKKVVKKAPAKKVAKKAAPAKKAAKKVVKKAPAKKVAKKAAKK